MWVPIYLKLSLPSYPIYLFLAFALGFCSNVSDNDVLAFGHLDIISIAANQTAQRIHLIFRLSLVFMLLSLLNNSRWVHVERQQSPPLGFCTNLVFCPLEIKAAAESLSKGRQPPSLVMLNILQGPFCRLPEQVVASVSDRAIHGLRRG